MAGGARSWGFRCVFLLPLAPHGPLPPMTVVKGPIWLTSRCCVGSGMRGEGGKNKLKTKGPWIKKKKNPSPTPTPTPQHSAPLGRPRGGGKQDLVLPGFHELTCFNHARKKELKETTCIYNRRFRIGMGLAQWNFFQVKQNSNLKSRGAA